MKRLTFICLLSIILLSSCDIIKTTDPGDNPSDPPYVPKTINWEADVNGYLQYFTDDKTFIAPYEPTGIRTWSFSGDTLTVTDKAQLRINKISGHNKGTFGLLICGTDSENNLYIAVDVLRRYAVLKILDNQISYIKDWTVSGLLKEGYNQENVITVENLGSYEYRLTFNDTEECTFTDNGVTKLEWGKFGSMVSVYQNEDFPLKPVDVRVKLEKM
jgi:hypothetical protein